MEFILEKQNIIKIGRSENVFKRFMDYPKGSILLFTVFTNNYKDIEKQLINSFCITYKARPDIGREYFEGDYIDMAKKITEITTNNKDEIMNINPKRLKRTDPTICIMDFVDEHRELFSNKTVKSKDVYNQLIEWTRKQNLTVYLTHTCMTNVLIKSFGVGHKVCRFADGVNQGIIFPDLHGVQPTIPISKKKCVKLNKQNVNDNGTSEVGTSEVGTSEVGTSEVGTSEVGTSEVGTSEVGTSEVGTSVVGTSVVGTSEVGTSEVGTREVGIMICKSYHCDRCGYSTNDKSNFMKHLNKKYICEPLLNEIDIKELIKKATFKEEDPNKIYECYTCNAKFRSRQGRYKHSKTCKDINKVGDIIDVL